MKTQLAAFCASLSIATLLVASAECQVGSRVVCQDGSPQVLGSCPEDTVGSQSPAGVAPVDIKVKTEEGRTVEFVDAAGRRLAMTNVIAETQGFDIRPDQILSGARATAVLLGQGRSSMLFVAYLDDDRDGFVDRLSITSWRIPVNQRFEIFPLGSDPGMRRDQRIDCDTYNVMADSAADGRKGSGFSVCPEKVEWNGPLMAPGTRSNDPVVLSDGFRATGIYTVETAVAPAR